jgi:hypothetical protein
VRCGAVRLGAVVVPAQSGRACHGTPGRQDARKDVRTGRQDVSRPPAIAIAIITGGARVTRIRRQCPSADDIGHCCSLHAARCSLPLDIGPSIHCPPQ